MRPSLVLLILAFAVAAADALSQSELKALEALGTSFPVLATKYPPWTSNISAACDSRPFYGLTCSDGPDPHVLELQLRSDFDGDIISGTMPKELGGLLWLEVLIIQDCAISLVIPDTIGLLQNLTSIRIHLDNSKTLVKTRLDGLSRLVNLKELELSLLFDGKLPFDIGKLGSLRRLALDCPGSMNPQRLPISFWSLHALESLSMKPCNFFYDHDVPSDIPVPFPRLRNFSYSDGPLKAIDTIINTSRNLTVIEIQSNISPSIRGFVGLSQLRHLNIISSGATGLLPEPFWETLPSLEVVGMSPEIYGSLSASIGSLKNLRTLDLSQSRLSGTIPPELTKCPLQQLYLRNIQFSHPLPDTFDRLNASLAELHITGLQGFGTMPNSIASLSVSTLLKFTNCGLRGTIPDLSQLKMLQILSIENNELTGTLPSIPGLQGLEAHTNRLTGDIPVSIANSTQILILSHNQLGPHLDVDIFTRNKILAKLDLSHNLFTGSLPRLMPYDLQIIDLSYNSFTGSVPSSYCTATTLRISHNQLSGSLQDLMNVHCALYDLQANGNQFKGTAPVILSKLGKLDLSDNFFSGPLPLLPHTMEKFYAGRNNFTKEKFKSFAESVSSGNLQLLDLTSLGLSFPEDPYLSIFDLVGPKMEYLYLAHNKFSSILASRPRTQLRGLDISNNSFSGSFLDNTYYPNLGRIRASHNAFTGIMRFDLYPALTEVDISENKFQFDASDISDVPLLTNINARGNKLYGSLDLGRLPSLEVADFSRNLIGGSLNLDSLGRQFVNSELRALNVSSNPNLLTIRMDTDTTGLARTHTSTPSPIYSSVICYDLAFRNMTGRVFAFDENLFNYSQCDCDHEHFGSPPSDCIACPLGGMTSCGGPNAVVSENSFVFLSLASTSRPSSPKVGARETPRFGEKFVDALRSFIEHASPSHADNSTNQPAGGAVEMHTESCLVNALQRLSGKSNCQGVRLAADILRMPNVTEDNVLGTQCRNGSEGRLCSKCSCDTSGQGECWFLDGPQCVHCRHAFKISVSLPVTVALIIMLIVVLGVVFGIYLRRKRVQSLRKWNRVSRLKRVLYRLQHLTSLGNISIMITFVQILLSFTQWDAYAQTALLGVVNGDVSKLGLDCIFPFLSSPFWSLIIRLSIPFVALLIVAASAGIGSRVALLMEKRASKRNSLIPVSSEGEEALILALPEEIIVKYPALALLTSLSITVIKFFYFGTALASHQYLFSSAQPGSGIYYSQHSPWMKYSEAWNLILTSIPSIIIFDIGLPVAFLVLCWKIRGRFNSPSIQIYFGSLFETYNPRCFWWEIVNTLKKLSIALSLRSFPDSDAAQAALVATILLGTLVIQTSINPWRRKSENIADVVSSVILCGALLATRPGQLKDLTNVIWYIFALSVLFILLSVALIAWHTIFDVTEYQRSVENFWNRTEFGAIQDQQDDPGMLEWTLESESDRPSKLEDSILS